MELAGARVLVTGARGFVAGYVGEELAARGARVVPFGRRVDPRGDVREAAAVRRAIEGIDVVVHLAVSPGYKSESDPRWDVEVNVLGTLNVLLAAREVKVQRVLHLSTSLVYGAGRGPVGEDGPAAPTTLYGASKLASEEYARMFARGHGLWVSVLRMSTLYGEPKEGAAPPNVVTRFTDLALEGRPIVITGEADRALDLLHVADAARACVAALENDRSGGRLYNIGSGTSVTPADVAHVVIEATSSSSELRREHGEASEPVPLLDIRRAREELGFAPRIAPLDGIARYARSRLSPG